MQTCHTKSILSHHHHPQVGEGFLIGLSSRVIAADTIRLSFRFLASAFCCSIVLPSLRTTHNFEWKCVRVPMCPRPRGSILVGGRGPLVTQASAVKRIVDYQINWLRITFTNNQFSFLQSLVPARMVSRCRQHIQYTSTGPLLAELHLKNSMVYWLSRYLSS